MKGYISSVLFMFWLLTSCNNYRNSSKVSLDSEEELEVEKLSDAHVSNKTSATQLSLHAKNSEKISDTSGVGIKLSGTVISSRQGLLSFKIPGHLLKVRVKNGDKVKKGSVLAELDATDFSLQFELARASVDQANISLEQSRKDYTRESALAKANATSLNNLERTSNALSMAKISAKIAEINSRIKERALNDTKLLTPYDATVTKSFKTEGEYMGVGQAVFEIMEDVSPEISLKVPENFIKKIKINDEINVTLPSINLSTSMKISKIVPVINESSRTFEAIGKITEAYEGILPGQFVEAEIL